jgi:hypothetical protein
MWSCGNTDRIIEDSYSKLHQYIQSSVQLDCSSYLAFCKKATLKKKNQMITCTKCVIKVVSRLFVMICNSNKKPIKKHH